MAELGIPFEDWDAARLRRRAAVLRHSDASPRRAGPRIPRSATATARSPGRCCSRPVAMSNDPQLAARNLQHAARGARRPVSLQGRGRGDPACEAAGSIGVDAGRRHRDRCAGGGQRRRARIRRWSTGWPGSRTRCRCARGRCGRRWPMCRRRPGVDFGRAAADLRRRRRRLLLALRHRQQAC